jgi:tetratricopeptide (TPR) repeat protein
MNLVTLYKMKKTLQYWLLFIICLFIFQACGTSLLYTSLDVLRPAKFSFDPAATRLLILNNAVPQPPNYGHKTMLLNESVKNVSVNTDSLALFCISALAEKFQDNAFFSDILLDVTPINQHSTFSKLSRIDSLLIIEYSENNDVDVIISLDRIKVNDLLSEDYIYEKPNYLASLELNFETNWSVYYPRRKGSTSLQFRDTLYWEAQSANSKNAFAQLPIREDALIDGALYVGQKTVNRFIPYWEKVDRYFFDSQHKIMRQAMDSIYVKNWREAIRSWENVIDSSKNNWLKAQASNNIAVTYELLEDIDNALKYAHQSYSLLETLSIVNYDYYERIALYYQDLVARKAEIRLLKKQLGE